MRRFYRDVEAAPRDDGHAVLLDGRSVKTPKRLDLLLPSRGLALAVAAEWAAQGQTIDVAAMPVTKLATSTLDLFPERAANAREELLGYAAGDLLCYRVPAPADLAERQAAAYDPWLAFARERLGAPMIATATLDPIVPTPGSLAALERAIGAIDPWRLMALHQATRLTGSLVLGFAIERGVLNAPNAFDLALLEELYEIEAWGLTEETTARHARFKTDLWALQTFVEALPERD